MNWLTLIAYIYHWEKRIDNEIIVFIYKDLKRKWTKEIKRMNGENE